MPMTSFKPSRPCRCPGQRIKLDEVFLDDFVGRVEAPLIDHFFDESAEDGYVFLLRHS